MPQNKNKRYSKTDVAFIKDNYKNMSVDDLAKHLQRTPKSVRTKIERLGLSLSSLERNTPYQWTDKDVEVLKENYLLPDYKIQKLLPRFSVSAITRKRLELGLRKHTYEPYINGEYYQRFEDGERVWVHREETEVKIGRKLKPKERVHHVNGNKLDNSHDNLYVCQNRSHHGAVHASLEKVAFELVKKGLIKFDHNKGEYYINE